MLPTVYVALFGWPIVVLAFFALLPSRRAVIASMLGAWLFLPMAGFPLSGLPDITKMSVTCVSVFLATLCFDAGRLAKLRPTWVDVPMVVWILVPIPSLLNAGYGLYEGVSIMLDQLFAWGLPYLIGRMYFTDADSLRELAIGFVIGGLVYLPLVLFEARMSPQLHTWVYGFHQHTFSQSRKGDGWRPTVFMQHGLAVAMFMGTSAVCAAWLWAAGRLQRLSAMPAWIVAGVLLATAASCRSAYALLLMLLGLAILFVSRLIGTRLLLVALLLVPALYVLLRTLGGWDAQFIRELASVVAADRTTSLDVRLTSEQTCWNAVQSSPLLGMGRIGNLMLHHKSGEQFIPDGLWLIAMGKFGLIGLAAMLASLLAPCVAYFHRHRSELLFGAQLAGATVIATVVVLYTLDSLLNAMVNPIYLVGAGGLGAVRWREQAARRNVTVRRSATPPVVGGVNA
jgi:O-antigen ligase